jgi:uncharacterized membrane protein
MTAANPSTNRPESAGAASESPRDKLFRIVSNYLRGWLLILALYFVAKAIGTAYSRLAASLDPLFESIGSAVPNRLVAIVILILGPWILGKLIELFLAGRLFRRQRSVRALQQMEKRLSTELRVDDQHGYRVVLVNWPSVETRSMGLIVADFIEPETGRELAAVYLPRTPDPVQGVIRVVKVEDVVSTDWGLSDLIRFHVTFGSAAPDLSDEVG